ncbi:MAG: serine/threonine protein kinase [bacterium]|nr:serine/threonine protein kinase [bacterium]
MSPLAQRRGFEPLPDEESGPTTVEKIGRFELVEEIGKGSMGIVYLARDPMIGRWVAVKKLTGIKGKALDPDTVRRLLINEARNVGALEHPGIVMVFDIVEDRSGEVEALAMEFVGGKSLRQRLDDPEPMSLKFISEILTAVAEVLDYAHENGCIHRDVKPANILLGNDGVIKVADFGIAALRGEDLASELRNLGTPNYLAPERVMGQPGDQRTDIYSLGVILYELLTRHLPFEATSIAELVQKIVQEEPTPPERFAPELMPGFKAVLARALAKEPGDRYETAGAIATEVREIVEAQAALNDTVPAPFPLRPKSAEAAVPEELERPKPEAKAESGPPSELLSPLEPTVAAPIEEVLRSHLEAELEEVEWESAVTAAPPAPEQEDPRGQILRALRLTRALGGRAWRLLRSLVPPAVSIARRGGVAVRERPAFAAVAAFVVALPLLLMAFSDGGAADPVVRSTDEPSAAMRRRVVGLLEQSRVLLAAGDVQAAGDYLDQAEMLFPVDADPGVSALIGRAAELEMERLDRIDEVAQNAHLEIARADFNRARASIDQLIELEAPEETLEPLEASLRQARERVRRARAAPEPEPPPVIVVPVPAPKPVRVVRAPQPAPKTGPGTLEIEFASARPRGVLTVFSGTTQILNRRYRFVEKKNFLVRKGVGGSFEESIELPEGSRDLRLYLTQPKRPTQHRPITVQIPPGESRILRLRVEADGRFVVDSR